MSPQELLAQPFGNFAELLRLHAARRPAHAALVQGERRITYGELDEAMDRAAAALRRDGVGPRESVAICGANGIEYALLFLGALRAGAVPALVPPSAGAESIARMVADSGAKRCFDEAMLAPAAFEHWVQGASEGPIETAPTPDWPFNIIYSSGTTGTPKGIVQPHSMRWIHMQRGPSYGYDESNVTLVATPLYSNTTLVSFFPALATGGTVVLMGKFDAGAWLALAARERVTHAMLVPVQYQRIMARDDFERHDLSSFRMKFSTSAPFAAELKRDVLARWPGGLVEYYGMTEGGGTCVLLAHQHPGKLHTVGKPAPGVDLRLVDDDGREVARGEAGEIVGHSGAMMSAYHNRPADTAQAEWRDASGKRFIRTGDVGRFDEDGFLVLLDRKKDVVISGGFNVYPSDIEAVLRGHPRVRDVAVAGVPSLRWGETPVAFAVAEGGQDAQELRDWANARLGKIQRLHAVELVEQLPRNAIGKVLKRELRDAYLRRVGGA
ncbi:MAG TPA: class I adenylate-forming enzyme family protein [Usitatibacter sp.]|nr:class I adenylate-forming enzyme family protein [Usitatibacter sp.]